MTKRSDAVARSVPRGSRGGSSSLPRGQGLRVLRFEALEDRRLLSVAPAPLAATSSSTSVPSLDALATAYPHIDPNLLGLFQSATAANSDTPASAAATALAGAAAEPQDGLAPSSLMFDSAGRVGVTITAQDVNQLLPALANLGFQTETLDPADHLVEGYLPSYELEAADALSSAGLLGVLPMYQPITSSIGTYTDQADNILQSDRVRAAVPGDNGTGVTVGVISDSFNYLNEASTDEGDGDLPASVDVLNDYKQSGATDEGRAMAQLVHHIAPGAAIDFDTGEGGDATFASHITALANAGCKIICDDLAYFDEPFFQDGTIAQAIDTVETTDNVSYFSAAGNNANQAYELTSVSFMTAKISAISGSSQSYYEFASGVDEQSITIPAGYSVNLVLQWNQPFYNASGVTNSLSLYLLNSAGSSVVKSATTNNVNSQTPYQLLQYTNSSSSAQTYNVVIENAHGTASNVGVIKYVDYGDGADITFNDYATNSPTINPHAGAADAMAVAAVPYFNQTNPESFTSDGPVTIYFSASGTALSSPQVRAKPDVASVNGTTTSFFAQDNLGDGLWHFFGTSAATPHAAAVAALMLSANASLTPAEIYAQLKATANPNIGGTPGNPNLVGSGLINAYQAVIGNPAAASVNTFDGFESGLLGQDWQVYDSGCGRTQVISTNSPFSGTCQLALDGSSNEITGYFGSTPLLNEAILNINALGASNVTLAFEEKDFGSDPDDYTMPPSFSGHGDYDGVALSVDGTNWYLIESLTGSASTNSWQLNSFNLSAIAAADGLTLSADTQIKFQHYVGTDVTSYMVPNQGFGFDNVQVSGGSAAVTAVSTTAAAHSYDMAGNTVPITVTFNEAVNVTGTPTLTLNDGGVANYASGSGGSTLTFNYTVTAGQNIADLDYASTTALALSGGSIKDGSGNSATLTLPLTGSDGLATDAIVVDTISAHDFPRRAVAVLRGGRAGQLHGDLRRRQLQRRHAGREQRDAERDGHGHRDHRGQRHGHNAHGDDQQYYGQRQPGDLDGRGHGLRPGGEPGPGRRPERHLHRGQHRAHDFPGRAVAVLRGGRAGQLHGDLRRRQLQRRHAGRGQRDAERDGHGHRDHRGQRHGHDAHGDDQQYYGQRQPGDLDCRGHGLRPGGKPDPGRRSERHLHRGQHGAHDFPRRAVAVLRGGRAG